MPSYKLQYFNARGFGEVSRQLFVLSGTEFEDVRIEWEDFPKHRSGTPFGQMPVLFVDGNPLPQSIAIARFLANEFGMAGNNNWESGWVDAIGDQYKDYISEIHSFLAALYGLGKGDIEKMRKEVAEPARDKFFSFIEKRLGESSSGFLVGDSLTWIDLAIVDHVDVHMELLQGFMDSFPKVLALKEKVQSIPQLKKWLETRPKTPN